MSRHGAETLRNTPPARGSVAPFARPVKPLAPPAGAALGRRRTAADAAASAWRWSGGGRAARRGTAADGEPLRMRQTVSHFMGYRFALLNFAMKGPGGVANFDYFRVGYDEATPVGGD